MEKTNGKPEEVASDTDSEESKIKASYLRTLDSDSYKILADAVRKGNFVMFNSDGTPISVESA